MSACTKNYPIRITPERPGNFVMNKLAPSILAADFNILGEQIREVSEAGAHYLHIDVMDGLFVPSISFGFPLIESIRRNTDIFFDCHLMINDPDRYLTQFAKAGADSITVHIEACKDPVATINAIKALGLKTGITLCPETPLDNIDCVLDMVDMVLVMSVHPGFGGQSFMPSSIARIEELKKKIVSRGLKTDIEVDGGITLKNLRLILDSGANVIVSGSSIFNGDITTNIREFKKIIK